MFTESSERQNQMRQKDLTVARSQLVSRGKTRLMCHSVEESCCSTGAQNHRATGKLLPKI